MVLMHVFLKNQNCRSEARSGTGVAYYLPARRRESPIFKLQQNA